MPARRHLRLRATRRLGTTRNTRGFIFAVAPMAQFRRFHGGKKRWKTHFAPVQGCLPSVPLETKWRVSLGNSNFYAPRPHRQHTILSSCGLRCREKFEQY